MLPQIPPMHHPFSITSAERFVYAKAKDWTKVKPPLCLVLLTSLTWVRT